MHHPLTNQITDSSSQVLVDSCNMLDSHQERDQDSVQYCNYAISCLELCMNSAGVHHTISLLLKIWWSCILLQQYFTCGSIHCTRGNVVHATCRQCTVYICDWCGHTEAQHSHNIREKLGCIQAVFSYTW